MYVMGKKWLPILIEIAKKKKKESNQFRQRVKMHKK